MCGVNQQLSRDNRPADLRCQLPADTLSAGCPPLFQGVSNGDFNAIVASGRSRVFARGEMLHFKGESVQQVLLLTSGFVKITQLGMSGTEVILRFGVPGDVLGAAGLLSTGNHYTTAHAFRPCRALIWEARAFKTLAVKFPVLHQNIARILGEDLVELEERFREVATERVGSRVARQLVRLRLTIGRQVGAAVEVGLSREELAQMTGTTLFTVSRLLSAWEASGFVKPSREAVTICDVQSLQSVSDE